MTSKLTREQMLERARENVKALKMASRQHAFESAREEILADLQIAEYALACLEGVDSEPVAEVVSIYGDPEAFGEREIRPLVGIQQMPYGTKLYRHAQPAPDGLIPAAQKLLERYLANPGTNREFIACWTPSKSSIGTGGVWDEWKALESALAASPQPTPDREQVRREHAEWSQDTFGNVGPIGPLKHLRREVLEVIAKPYDLIEWADMQFLLWDAQRRAGITDEQITQAMIEKLAVNKLREWPAPKDGEPRLHIKGQPVPDGFPPDEIECDICGHVSTDPEGRHHCCEDNSND